MKSKFYVAPSIIIIELMMVVFIFAYLCAGPDPEYLSWFKDTDIRSEHAFTYKLLLFLGPVAAAILLSHLYKLVSKKHIRFDADGIHDSFTFRNYGLLPWDNITAVEIQVGKRGTGIVAIHLDKPVKGKHLIKLDYIGINKSDVMMLSQHYAKIEESHSLAILGR